MSNENVCLCGHTKNQHGAYGVCNHFMNCACSKYTPAQQSVHLTAFGRTVWAFCAGFVSGLLACLAVIGGR